MRLEVTGGGLLELLASVVLGLLPVEEVETLGLEFAVDEGTGDTGEDLLGVLVARGLAVPGNMVLVSFHGLEGSGAGNELVAELGLVFLAAVVVLELVVGLSLLAIVIEPTHG